MADREMTCPLDGMFSTRNVGELVAHEPAKTTFVRSGVEQEEGETVRQDRPGRSYIEQRNLYRSYLAGLGADGEGFLQKKVLGMPMWVALLAAAGGAYLLAKK